MATAAELAILISAKTTADAALASTKRSLGDVGETAKKTGSEVQSAGAKMDGALKNTAESLIPIELGWAGLGVAAVAGAKMAFNAASDMQENISKVEVVFDSSAASIKRWSEGAATNLGMSQSAALEAAGTLGNMLTAMEMTEPAAAKMSRGIVQLAADMGSFNNVPTAEALEAIRAGLIGETEPLRRFGVNLNAAAIESKALEMGLAATGKELTAAHKAQAAYALILEQTTSAQGDFARTSDGAANSIKTAQASIDDATAAIGQGLVPVVAMLAQDLATVVVGVTNLTNAMNDLGSSIPGVSENTDLLFGALRAGLGPLNGVVTGFGLVNKVFGETEDKSVPVIQFIREIAAAMPEATTNAHELAFGITEVKTALDKLTGSAPKAGGESGIGMVGKSIHEVFRASQLAKGELTEFGNSAEMVADSVERANQELAYMGEASRLAIEGQANLNTQWTEANQAVSFWESQLSNAEKALKILDGELEENGKLTDEQQRQYDILTQAQRRYIGGIEDEEGAVVDAAVAQAEFIAKQDELNQLLADGKLKPHEYARAMADLTAETDPAASSTYNMAAAQGDLMNAMNETINKLGNLLIDLGLLPESKRTEFSTPGADDAQRELDELKEKADRVPKSLTIDAYVNLAAAQNALNELRGMTFTQSPPKKGPMSGFVPDWSYLFEGLETAAEDFGSKSMERIKSYLTGLDLDTILRKEVDLQSTIAELQAVFDGLVQMGETDAAAALAEELTRLRQEAEHLAAIIGTDAVQAWLDNEDAAKAAAEAAEAALKAQEEAAEALRQKHEELLQSYYDIVTALSEGGDTAAGFFEQLVANAQSAEDALDWARILGMPPETIARLEQELAAAEDALGMAGVNLANALRDGMIDQETLRLLAEAGGEWFRALYDSLFGEDALADLEDGWNQISDASLEHLKVLMDDMADGGAEMMEELVDAVRRGAIDYDEMMGLLADATGEEVNAVIEELERLQTALIVDLANALVTGTDPTQLKENLAVIEQLLAGLADRAVETTEQVSRSVGEAAEVGGRGPTTDLVGLVRGLESNPQALTAFTDRVYSLNEALRDVHDGGALAADTLALLDRNLDGVVDQNELIEGHAWFNSMQDALMETGHLAESLWDSMTPPDDLMGAIGDLEDALGRTGSAAEDAINVLRGDYIKDPETGKLRIATAQERELYGGGAAVATAQPSMAVESRIATDDVRYLARELRAAIREALG